jgi:hypothetical protein
VAKVEPKVETKSEQKPEIVKSEPKIDLPQKIELPLNVESPTSQPKPEEKKGFFIFIIFYLGTFFLFILFI